MNPLRTLALFGLVLFCMLSCNKDTSEGEESLVATGTLKVNGSGECLPASVQGTYTAGTALTTGNFINVTVNITEPGTYSIATNTVNGYSYSATGTATITGEQTIKLTGSGTPTTAGANTFTITFGTSQCNMVVTVVPAGTPAAVFSALNCTGAVIAGTYQQGTATGPGNTVQVSATVATAGTYNITTNTVNGVSFSGSGTLTAGTHTITLTANGTPANSGVVNYTVTAAGASSCNFNITYTTSAPPTGTYTWSFKVGTTVYSGITQVSEQEVNPPQVTVWGPHSSGAEFALTIIDRTPSASLTTGTYPGLPTISGLPTGRYTWSLYYSGGTPYYEYYTGNGTSINTNITVFNTTTKIIEGNFSGTARQGNGTTGPIITISEGVFKARLP